MGIMTATFRDNSDELSRITVRVPDLTGPDVWTVITGLAGDFETHLEGISLATLKSIVYSQDGVAEDDTRPASLLAQRESGLRFFYQDDVNGDKGTLTVAAPDLASLKTPGTDEADLAAAPIANLITWLEANALSKGGNAIAINRAVFVGRNN